jgi:hypothetical protein
MIIETEKQQYSESASQKVLAKIQAHELTMRPKLHFTLKSLALALVAIVILILSVSIGSFILFTIRASHQAALLGFGVSGYVLFFRFFPWTLLTLDILSIITLQWMLRKFRFGYKSPLLYLLLSIVAVTLLVSTVVDRSHGSDSILRGAHHHGIPFVGNLFDQGRRPLPRGSGVCPCTIMSVGTSTLTAVEYIPNEPPRTIAIILPDSIATSSIHIGDRLLLVGREIGDTLHVFDIRPMTTDVDPDSPPLPPTN